jgi:hypothetical protein
MFFANATNTEALGLGGRDVGADHGNVGGARAIEQLREVAVEFEMAPLRPAVHILPDVMVPILRSTEDPADLSPLDALRPKLDLLVDDLVWMHALAAARTLEGAA